RPSSTGATAMTPSSASTERIKQRRSSTRSERPRQRSSVVIATGHETGAHLVPLPEINGFLRRGELNLRSSAALPFGVNPCPIGGAQFLRTTGVSPFPRAPIQGQSEPWYNCRVGFDSAVSGWRRFALDGSGPALFGE